MLTELHRKSGQLCQSAKSGNLRCPLIIRSTSEDVITGHLVQSLRILNPRWWLADFLNSALGEQRFRRQHYRRLRIQPWVNQVPYPRELLPWKEGSTQVDLVISWENPPTTVFIEAKYQSGLSKTTSNATSKFPSDQLIRNIRVGLFSSGYFNWHQLINVQQRDFITIVLAPKNGNYLVKKYRNESKLLKAIPCSDRLTCLPSSPFVGELDYRDINRILNGNMKWFSRPERTAANQLIEYLDMKLQTAKLNRNEFTQSDLFES